MTALIDDALILLGLLCSLFVVVRYSTQGWYKNPIGPIIMIAFVIMTFLYGKSALSIFTGHEPMTGVVYTVTNAVCAALSVYGAVVVDRLVRIRSRQRRLDRDRKRVDERLSFLSSTSSTSPTDE